MIQMILPAADLIENRAQKLSQNIQQLEYQCIDSVLNILKTQDPQLAQLTIANLEENISKQIQNIMSGNNLFKMRDEFFRHEKNHYIQHKLTKPMQRVIDKLILSNKNLQGDEITTHYQKISKLTQVYKMIPKTLNSCQTLAALIYQEVEPQLSKLSFQAICDYQILLPQDLGITKEIYEQIIIESSRIATSSSIRTNIAAYHQAQNITQAKQILADGLLDKAQIIYSDFIQNQSLKTPDEELQLHWLVSGLPKNTGAYIILSNLPSEQEYQKQEEK